MRKTHALVQAAQALMADPSGTHWGYDLSRKAGVRSGVLYPILHRMLDDGWLSDGWEDIDSEAEKRPPRRYYQLTEKGATELGAVLRAAASDVRFRGFIAGWAQ